jgi:hypothetical protein
MTDTNSKFGYGIIGEWKCTANRGTIALDQIAATNPTTNTSCTSCTGSSFTGLAGKSDLLIQAVNEVNSWTAITSPYVLDYWKNPNFAYALGSLSAGAPTLKHSPAGGLITIGLAFK